MAELDLNPIINRVLEAWAPELTAQLRGSAQKKRIRDATGKGLSSFREEVQKAGNGQLAVAYFEFEQYLRILDMKYTGGKQLPVDDVKEHIREVGISKFLPRFRRKNKVIPKNPHQLLNKVAWGLARGKKRKQKKWYGKPKQASIFEMYGRMLDEIADEVLRGQIQTIKN